MEAAEKQLRRLIALDAGLASPAGVRLADYAAEHSIDDKTARRLINSIKSTGLEIESKRTDDATGYYWTYRYAGRFRLFSMHAHRASV